ASHPGHSALVGSLHAPSQADKPCLAGGGNRSAPGVFTSFMAVTREQFDAGLTYDAYKAQMTRNREQVDQNEKDLDLTPTDAQAFQSLPQPINVMAQAEDWCGDVVANLPILGRIAAESNGKLNVRIHLRDQEPGSQIMDQYLNKGQFKSIPTFIFLD